LDATFGGFLPIGGGRRCVLLPKRRIRMNVPLDSSAAEVVTRRLRAPAPRRRSGGDASLRVVSGPERGVVIGVRTGTWLIGRGRDADVRLTSRTVSRAHAKLVIESGGAIDIVDLAATNPTRVNGRTITRLGLRNGDRIEVGDVELHLETDGCVDARPKLTSRELEVAHAVMDGLTNSEIGGRLGISPRTVGTHLANIYERLEINSRAQLTRIVLERGVTCDAHH
jgi:DNA-binding CsgD family transcriptional regulator